MSFSPADLDFMRRALALAEQAIGLSDPNPRVGCVLVSPDGRVLGEGHTQEAGGPHAEVMALREADRQGHDVRGATAYVTLEPCSHHGRTPPCADALVNAQVARVVIAMEDPNPVVSGQGAARLRAHGIAVDRGLLAEESLELNIGFHSRMTRGRPWVRLKAAMSLDGRTALPTGESKWITGEAARADGHVWRKRAGAVLTGIGTVLHDDPRMDVRLALTKRQPMRIVLDSRLRVPASARVLQSPGERVIYTTTRADSARATALRLNGVDVITLPASGEHIDLQAVAQDLARRDINELHVEAGAQLNGAWLTSGLVDELLLYIAPCLLGQGLPLACVEHASLGEVQRWSIRSVCQVGEDLRVISRVNNT